MNKRFKTFSKIKDNAMIIRIVILFSLTVIIVLVFLLLGELNKASKNVEFTLSDTDPRLEFYRSFVPLRRWDIKEPSIAASGILVALMDQKGDKFLFEKNSDISFPIASVTKLMTALIAIEKYDLDHQLVISEEAFRTDAGRPNSLYPGEIYKVRELLYSSLLESGNTAAQALAEGRTILDYNRTAENFIARMNEKAQLLGMKKTYFSNPTGLDPLVSGTRVNRSSPRDLLILTNYLMNYPLIWEILSTTEHDLRTSNGTFKYKMKNTNEFIDKNYPIKGGKTGQTTKAGENLLAVFKRENSYLFTLILGSNNRFEDTQILLEWIEEAYFWKTI